MQRRRVLVVDDSLEMARLLADQLGDLGYEVAMATGGEGAALLLERDVFDAVITDLRMEKVDGFDLLELARKLDPPPPVLIMTAFGAVESAVEAMRRGAFHYFTKPFRLEEVRLSLERALEARRMLDENRTLRRLARARSGLQALVGASQAMRALYETIERAAHSAAPVLLRGESGSGKELVARALHLEGPRASAPFVAVNCTALPASLLESELFGHLKGAFTGASAPRRGLFVEAHGGTLFLDEIGDMPAELQAKLLRVLETGEVRAVGSDEVRTVDVRIVAATHQDLEKKIRDGSFRQDLFYRLNVVPIRLPSLRERREDIPRLAAHFLARSRERNPRSPVERLGSEALQLLGGLTWPGNVRELENLVERAVVLGGTAELDRALLERLLNEGASEPASFSRERLMPLRQMEDEYIRWVLASCEGNKTRAAEILGIDVSTIHRRERERRDEKD
ncbi:MAG: sigma-54-dependent Fis family transcriptional regulator [Deltaproteobacteria bacterium]|nr:sigma-54-dependent Fis family transcriptional regulator [Deltaproteobacteria bacterium]